MSFELTEELTVHPPAAYRTNKSKGISRRPGIVITYPYPLGEASGGSRMTREIARYLGKLGADVVILPVSTNGLSRGFPRASVDEKFLGVEFDEELSQASVEIIRVSQNPFHFELDGLSVKKALKAILTRYKIDIVLSYYHEAAFLPSFLRSQKVKFGYIATWFTYERMAQGRTWNVRKFFRNWKNQRLIVKPYRQADIILATSQHTRNQLVDILGVAKQRIKVCYLGVDPVFTKIPRTKRKEITRLLFFGRVVPKKGFIDALQALGQLGAKGIDNWNFRIVGDGRHDLAKQAAHENGIADKVTVCDAVDDQGLQKELEQADLAIMPSHDEAFGLSFAEAQAAGVPIIAYEAGSVPEVVENEVTGWLAPLGDVDQLAQRIRKAIQDPEAAYRAGMAARERVKRMFTWEKTAMTILDGMQALV